jgi:hypothetical protein
MNRWAEILASLVTRLSRTRSRDPGTRYPRPAESDDTSSRQADSGSRCGSPRPETARPLADLPSVTSPGQEPDCPGTARRRLPSVTAAGLSLCNGSFRRAIKAEERLPDSFHAARSSRSKIAHDLEPRYGIEP